MDECTANELKQLELDMLKLFIQICEQLDLTYYILGGTLLGAVRHNGFIPWDDDIDVGMPRADYDKFVSVGQKYMPENYFVQAFNTDPEFPANFAKIRNSNTTFIETSLGLCNINHGVYIDIFPLDYYPDKVSLSFKIKKKLLTQRISCAFANQKLKLMTRLVRGISRIVYPSQRKAIIRREKLFKSYNYGCNLANHCGAWGEKEIIPAEWYGEGIELIFEGIVVNAPAEYDKWLTQVYGNYMEWPPLEKRVAHHYTDIIDLDRPYTYYRKREEK